MNSQPSEPGGTGAVSEAGDLFLERILVAEDDPVSRRVLERILTEHGFHVDCVQDGAQALERGCAPGSPRLIVLDWIMPGMCGPDICKQLRQQPAGGYQYIILLSSNDKKADVVTGLEAGADDYLTKPFDAPELLARIRVGLRLLTLQNRLFAAQEKLRFQATHDALTGIWNRGALLELMRSELERAQRRSCSLATLMLDIDRFKQVNDMFGHQCGDTVLKLVVHRLAATVRAYDLIGRYGGEEFLVLAELEPEQAREYAERLRACVAASPIETEGQSQMITVSIGVALAGAGAVREVEQLISLADCAMYRAKRNGRNRVELVVQPDAAAK